MAVHGNEPRLPVVALDDVRRPVQGVHGLQTPPGKEGEPLPVVRVAVDRPVPGAEVVVVIKEINLHPVVPDQQTQNTAVLLPPAQPDVALGHLFRPVSAVVLDLSVPGQKQLYLVFLHPGKGGGKSLHHIAQTPGLDIGRALGGADCNFHSVSPRLMRMGF